ncbi:MAG TPA: adenosine deaminase, partial [bacterium]|nr:adenosine deaminase [bacterium]
GTRLREDGDLLIYVNDLRLPLEVCLSSNAQTGAVKRIEDHPFPFYLDLGLRVTLNTDNLLITDTTMTDEYLKAYQLFGLAPQQILDLVINGVKSAFVPYHQKRDMLRAAKKKTIDLINSYAGTTIIC